MKTSEQLDKIAPALASAVAVIGAAHKNAKNPHFRNSYADISAVLDATKPALAEHGIAAIQTPGWNDGRLTLTTRLLHTSGQWIESTAETPVSKQDPQGVGSAITYLRRYSLTAMLGVAQDDDDGNAAARPSKPGPNVAKAKQTLQRATQLLERAEASEEVETLAKYTAGLERAVQANDDERCAKAVQVMDPLIEAIEKLDLADA